MEEKEIKLGYPKKSEIELDDELFKDMKDIIKVKEAVREAERTILLKRGQLNYLRKRVITKIERILAEEKRLNFPEDRDKMNILLERYHELAEIHDTIMGALSVTGF